MAGSFDCELNLRGSQAHVEAKGACRCRGSSNCSVIVPAFPCSRHVTVLSMPGTHHCPKCQAPLSPADLEGLCPRCVAQAASAWMNLETVSDGDPPADAPIAPIAGGSVRF